MKLKLTQKQLDSLETIKWLFSDNPPDRGAGRTTLLAYYFITKAIESGKPVEIFDHFMPSHYVSSAKSIMPVMVKMLTDYFTDYNYEYNMVHNTISVSLKAKDATGTQA